MLAQWDTGEIHIATSTPEVSRVILILVWVARALLKMGPTWFYPPLYIVAYQVLPFLTCCVSKGGPGDEATPYVGISGQRSFIRKTTNSPVFCFRNPRAHLNSIEGTNSMWAVINSALCVYKLIIEFQHHPKSKVIVRQLPGLLGLFCCHPRLLVAVSAADVLVPNTRTKYTQLPLPDKHSPCQ